MFLIAKVPKLKGWDKLDQSYKKKSEKSLHVKLKQNVALAVVTTSC